MYANEKGWGAEEENATMLTRRAPVTSKRKKEISSDEYELFKQVGRQSSSEVIQLPADLIAWSKA